MRTCDTNIYRVQKTVFEELEDMDFEFEPNDKFSPYFAMWDLQSFQVDISNESEATLQWLSEHVPVA